MILLRHGQSEFNLHFTATKRDPGIKDPKLTPLGQSAGRGRGRGAGGRGHPPHHLLPLHPRAADGRAGGAAAGPARHRQADGAGALRLHLRHRHARAPRCAIAWPQLDFDHIDEVWWPPGGAGRPDRGARRDRSAAEMAALADWPHTLVVSHWGFILAMTGQRVMNGEWLRCDPTTARAGAHHLARAAAGRGEALSRASPPPAATAWPGRCPADRPGPRRRNRSARLRPRGFRPPALPSAMPLPRMLQRPPFTAAPRPAPPHPSGTAQRTPAVPHPHGRPRPACPGSPSRAGPRLATHRAKDHAACPTSRR